MFVFVYFTSLKPLLSLIPWSRISTKPDTYGLWQIPINLDVYSTYTGCLSYLHGFHSLPPTLCLTGCQRRIYCSWKHVLNYYYDMELTLIEKALFLQPMWWQMSYHVHYWGTVPNTWCGIHSVKVNINLVFSQHLLNIVICLHDFL